MKRTLLDEGVPIGLRDLLGRDDVRHVRAIGWAGLPDSEIIERAASERFEVFVTTDRNLRYQQNLGAKKLAFVILHTTDLEQDWEEVSGDLGRDQGCKARIVSGLPRRSAPWPSPLKIGRKLTQSTPPSQQRRDLRGRGFRR